MIIYVFGNPDLPADSLPLKILPELKKRFPQLQFAVKDPHEEWDCPETVTVIDTVKGIGNVTVFEDLTKFASAPSLTLHDFDALANLRYLQKLGKLKKIKIIGMPAEMHLNKALASVAEKIKRECA
ncbi:MAG: hypothetical protein ABSB00_03215 [Minisyncoccia bacterium]|jgi:hypothetical protein